MTHEEGVVCTICQKQVNDNHCSTCGQQIPTKKTTFTSMITDFISNVFSLERSVFAAIFKIITDPRLLIESYWDGYRKYYPSPGKMFFYALAIAALHLSYVDPLVLGLTLEIQSVKSQIAFWVLLFPLILLTSYVGFLPQKRGITPHIVSTMYLSTSFYMALTIINDLLIKTANDPLGANVFIIFIFCVFCWNSIVFTKRRKIGWLALNTLIQITIFISTLAGLVLLVNHFWGGS